MNLTAPDASAPTTSDPAGPRRAVLAATASSAISVILWAVLITLSINAELDYQESRLGPDEDMSLAGLAYLLPIVVGVGGLIAALLGLAITAMMRTPRHRVVAASASVLLVAGGISYISVQYLLSLESPDGPAHVWGWGAQAAVLAPLALVALAAHGRRVP